MSDSIISVEKLSKSYLLGHQGSRERYSTLRDVISRNFKNLARSTSAIIKGKQIVSGDDIEEFWALKDVSFEVKRGEVLGIIGRNGAGKSTLLKILSRITEPTRGRIKINGRVASLLEVGTGFHPELTGRENIFLNGAILGMARAEIREKFDEIVSFAEVEKFLDTPVKRYSSGMYVRLAFAVAAHLEPEILIVDEVLAVGDAQFQKKCLGRIKDVAGHGRTVLFVSHNMQAVAALCSRAILLKSGQLVMTDSPQKIIDAYSNQYLENTTDWKNKKKNESNKTHFEKITINIEGKQPNLELIIKTILSGKPYNKELFLAFDILDSRGFALMQAIPEINGFIKPSNTSHEIITIIDLPPLIPGNYYVQAWVGSHFTETHDHVQECVSFRVDDSPTIGRSYPHSKEHGFIVPKSRVGKYKNIENK